MPKPSLTPYVTLSYEVKFVVFFPGFLEGVSMHVCHGQNIVYAAWSFISFWNPYNA